MIYIYNPKSWKDPIRLAKALREIGAEAKATSKEMLLQNASLVVNWGFRNTFNTGLNAAIIGNKLKELEKFKAAGVNTIEFSTEKKDGWLVRRLKHKSGNDLIQNLDVGDYYVKKIENIENEFRVHIFKDKSIRIGIKRPQENPHPWIRSIKRGWWLDYGSYCQDRVVTGIRATAKKAISSLGYDFGAVDVAVLSNGKSVVFEVNSAPGLGTENTALAYAKHIKQLVQG